MIDLREIRETIDDIKRTGTTVGQAEKLALLYIVEERLSREEMPAQTAQNYAQAAGPETHKRTAGSEHAGQAIFSRHATAHGSRMFLMSSTSIWR